jgi:hypothetical protein
MAPLSRAAHFAYDLLPLFSLLVSIYFTSLRDQKSEKFFFSCLLSVLKFSHANATRRVGFLIAAEFSTFTFGDNWIATVENSQDTEQDKNGKLLCEEIFRSRSRIAFSLFPFVLSLTLGAFMNENVLLCELRRVKEFSALSKCVHVALLVHAALSLSFTRALRGWLWKIDGKWWYTIISPLINSLGWCHYMLKC